MWCVTVAFSSLLYSFGVLSKDRATGNEELMSKHYKYECALGSVWCVCVHWVAFSSLPYSFGVLSKDRATGNKK